MMGIGIGSEFHDNAFNQPATNQAVLLIVVGSLVGGRGELVGSRRALAWPQRNEGRRWGLAVGSARRLAVSGRALHLPTDVGHVLDVHVVGT